MSYSSVFFNRKSGYVHFWQYNDKGEKKHLKEKAPLYFYMKNDAGEYTSIYGDKLKKVEFDDYQKYREAKEMYKAADRKLFESDVDVEQRFIMDNYSGKTLVPPKFDIHFIDIEVHSEQGFPKAELAEHPITIITVYSTKQERYFIFAEKDFDRSFLPANSYVDILPDEKELIKKFIGFTKKLHPDFITGFNSNGFDIPYIINRSNKLLGEEITRLISPVKFIRKVIKKGKFKRQTETYEIGGINCIDYLDLYRKYHQGEQESFKLDYIAKVEIGEQKLKFEGTLKELYHNNWQKYVEYNVQDVSLLIKLDKRIGFMDMMIGICYNCRVPFEKFDKTTRVLDGAFISRLMLDKIILPDVLHDEEEGTAQYEGAYVKDPIVGMYDWVMSFDATSLYPSIMMQHNISPETKMYVVNQNVISIINDALEGKIVDENELKLNATVDKTVSEVIKEIKDKGHSISSNGVVYRHDVEGIVPRFVNEWFNKRKHHKKMMEKAIENKNDIEAQKQKGYSNTNKVLINSVYGVLGSKYFRLFDADNAIAVTKTGQEIIKASMNSIDTYFSSWKNIDLGKKLKAENVTNVIIAGDTDSIGKDSLIRNNKGEKKTIENIFVEMKKDINSKYEIKDNGREFVFPPNLEFPYYDETNKTCQYGRVQYIEKHLVKKKMFRIKTKSGKYVDITEDHSCMVMDSNGKMIEKKPLQLVKGDKVICIV
jgi:DNA polymerase elongation subunit (family B)